MPSKKNQAPTTPAPAADEPDGPPPPEPVPPVQVLYCAVCSYPPEYCEFGSSLTKCKEWIKETHPDLYEKYYSEDALTSKVGTLSLEAQAKLEKEAAKKEAKAEAKADAALKKKLASQVTIKRIERNKRKHVTSIHGLEAFGVDLKKAAKQFSSKFATGASVTKDVQGRDEIVVQGDVSYEIVEMIEAEAGVLKGIPPDKVDVVEEKKKKGGD
ncbi:putative translation machinery-associated protein 22 [Lyophyllum shimeji]|uniref:Translation machinery-associated protein 22 n=1 Tax=Lyophyllum shimeji TaxID=47721 RepID=A0A9P3PFC3_LYOSH|nr:putative translation machinery-associated protein 22 [Lyophyllum shimeji]